MKTKLITALRIAANRLETGTFPYRWDSPERCNCGVVACVLTGMSPSQLDETLDDLSEPGELSTSWTARAGYHCPVTGAPTEGIFRTLHDAGLGATELNELEYLSNPRVLARCDFGSCRKTTGSLWWKKTSEEPVAASYNYKQHVITYLRAWADLLTEEGAHDSAPAEKATTSATA